MAKKKAKKAEKKVVEKLDVRESINKVCQDIEATLMDLYDISDELEGYNEVTH